MPAQFCWFATDDLARCFTFNFTVMSWSLMMSISHGLLCPSNCYFKWQRRDTERWAPSSEAHTEECPLHSVIWPQ